MAVEIMQYFGEDLENVDLITGSKGEFEVFANGELIFSKTQSGRFPDWKGDLLTPLKARAPLKAEAKT